MWEVQSSVRVGKKGTTLARDIDKTLLRLLRRCQGLEKANRAFYRQLLYVLWSRVASGLPEETQSKQLNLTFDQGAGTAHHLQSGLKPVRRGPLAATRSRGELSVRR